MAKKRRKKLYTTAGRSSYVAGYNLGKGQLDKIADQSLKNTNTNLTPSERIGIENDIMEWGWEYWEGIFRLGEKNTPELRKIFPSLRQALVREGEIVVIRKGEANNYYYLLADIFVDDKIKQIKRNLGGQIIEMKVAYRNKKGLIGNLVENINSNEMNEADFTIKDFVIFYNNSQGLPELRRGRHKINQIIKIEQQFLKDLEVSRPRIMAYHPLITSQTKAEALKKYIFEEVNDLITIASLNEGDKPTLHNWPGDSKQEHLWSNYTKSLTEWKRLNGIRTNTGKKKQTQLTKEIELVEEQFETLENSRYNSMVEALEECKEKWGWEYKLLKPDEIEESETDLNIKQLEKELRIEELKKQIRELKTENNIYKEISNKK